MAFTDLKVGGVPEHFNLPWHLAIEKKKFEKYKLNILWKDYPGGTGAMCTDLRNGNLDIAVLLTEGILADILKGNPSRIIQWYVTTPLIWGIHVPAHSDFKTMEDVQGKRYAISRFGSGSHLMAYADAQARGWQLKEEQFVVVHNLDGAKEAFKNNKADIFMWEKFMTKPLVDAGLFRRIDERPTPWPCFVIAASDRALSLYKNEIQKMQEIINESCKELMKESYAVSIIASRYNLQEKDVREWFEATKWSTGNVVETTILEKVMNTLLDLKLTDKKIPIREVCSDLCKLE